ncbi:MAG: T9SS type A sorting domain-containing protein [Bacteroidia bacterium]|nr:T9SS type A sorting domain-containing protein [Bacteroidia bacterium]MCF8427363.1 T9SS type A sorting domain-containing protein [Bacteroidia bacterium]MCF8447869.1 T9SS type A sorting domain-containing protein [Bacteroidia bacterium]
MKKIILQLMIASSSVIAAFAQTPLVEKYTKVDMNILATPAKGTVIPTSDGGYFMSKGLSLIKYDSLNAVVWTQNLKATERIGYAHKINAICDDGLGGAIITGEFNGTLSFGNDSLAPFYTASGSDLYSADAFVARINQTGKIWMHRLGEADNFSLGTDRGVSVKVTNNKVYWLAHGKGRNLRFNNVNYPSNQYSNNIALLCQLSLDGTVDWVNVNKGFLQPAELAVHGNNIFFTGFNLGSSTAINFGNNITISYSQGSLIAVKFNNTGEAQWAVIYDSDNSINNYSGTAIDNDGNLYVSGLSSKWTASYGIRPSSGYLVKINGTDGKQVWTRVSNFGIKGPVFSDGKIYIAGNTNGSVYLQTNGTDSIEFKRSATATGTEQWVASFDKNGTMLGSVKASVAGGLVGSTIEYLESTNNRVIMAGIFSYGNVFGNVTLPMTGMNVGAYHIGFFEIKTGSGSVGIENKWVQTPISLYPNPAKAYFMIETADNTPILSISLRDISGKKVNPQYLLQNNLANVNTAMLHTGIYFVEITTTNGITYKKILID